MKGKRRGRKTQTRTDGTDCSFPIVPDTSLLFPAALRGVHTPLSLPMETGKTRNNKQ